MSDLIPGENGGGFGDIQSLINIFTQLFGGGGSNTTGDSQSPEALTAAQNLMTLLGPEFNSGQFSPEQADRDSAGQVTQIIRQMTEAGLPVITGAENASGGYNSTAGLLLKNDLATRTAEAGAARIAATRTQYASARSAQISQMIMLIRAMSDAHRTNTTNTTTNALINSTNARRAAAAAAAAAALRAMTRGRNPASAGAKPPKPPKPPNSPSANPADPSSPGDESEGMGFPPGELPQDINRDDVLGLDMTGDPSIDDTSQIDDFDHGGAIPDVIDNGVIDLGDLGNVNPETFNFTDILGPDPNPNGPDDTFTGGTDISDEGDNGDGVDLGDITDLGDNTDFIDWGDGGGGGGDDWIDWGG